MNTDYKVYIADVFFMILPFIILHGMAEPLISELLIQAENTIACRSDYSFAFFLPMGFFLAFLLNFLFKMRRLKKRENKVWNPIEKTDRKKQKIWKTGFSLICVFVFALCSLLLCAGILRRTVITDDYNVKNYNFAGQVNAELEPGSIRFMKIYPEAEYFRREGFNDIYAVAEIYINENDCYLFTSRDFDSFEKLCKYKKTVEDCGIKVYVSDRAVNEPDPEEDYLSDDKIMLLENFYAQYECLK